MRTLNTIVKKTAEIVKSGWSEDDKLIVVAEYGMSWLKGNRQPYFSMVGELWTRKNYARYYNGDTRADCLSCGQIRKDILQGFPELEELFTYHLWDQDGTPMYYIENGMHWLGRGKYGQNNPAHFKSTVGWGLSPMDENFDPRELAIMVMNSDPADTAAVQFLLEMRLPDIQAAFLDAMKRHNVELIRYPKCEIKIIQESANV